MNLAQDKHPAAKPSDFCIVRVSVRAPFRPLSHSDLSSAQACVLVCLKAASVMAMEGIEPFGVEATRRQERALGLATFCATLFSASCWSGIRVICGEPPRRAVFETSDIQGSTGASATMATVEFALDRWNSDDIDDYDAFERAIAKTAQDLAALLRSNVEPAALATRVFCGPEAPMSPCAQRALELLDTASSRAESLAIGEALGLETFPASLQARL